jgi:hypothetical protein
VRSLGSKSNSFAARYSSGERNGDRRGRYRLGAAGAHGFNFGKRLRVCRRRSRNERGGKQGSEERFCFHAARKRAGAFPGARRLLDRHKDAWA